MTYEELIDKIENWERALEKYHTTSDLYKPVFGHDVGKKYIRVWRAENWESDCERIHKCAFAFVDMEGNLISLRGGMSLLKGYVVT